jgi:hypothetical protein
MVVIGNPPYSISSSNKGEWILNLIKVYKKDLNEKKINIDDDYHYCLVSLNLKSYNVVYYRDL